VRDHDRDRESPAPCRAGGPLPPQPTAALLVATLAVLTPACWLVGGCVIRIVDSCFGLPEVVEVARLFRMPVPGDALPAAIVASLLLLVVAAQMTAVVGRNASLSLLIGGSCAVFAGLFGLLLVWSMLLPLTGWAGPGEPSPWQDPWPLLFMALTALWLAFVGVTMLRWESRLRAYRRAKGTT
jgi:hypothetical protein